MSDKKPKPGKDSGVTAPDLVKSNDVGQMKPGKQTLVDSFEVGDAHIDHGAVCDGKDMTTEGCFMADDQRGRLVTEFLRLSGQAADSYKGALVELKVEELLKKEEDLSMFLTIALDLAGAFILNAVVETLKHVKARQIQAFTEAATKAVSHGADVKVTAYEKLLRNVTDDAIKAKVKSAGGFVMKHVTKGVHDATAPSEKSAVLAYIDQLRDTVDLSYYTFSTNAAGSANDAELVVLWEGMLPQNHTPGLYKAALAEKLERFRKSGVPQIGRRYDTGDASEHKRGHGIVDRRVVWMKHRDGSKTLWYQTHRTDDDSGNVRKGEPDSIAKEMWPDHHDSFGEMGDADTKLAERVPDEFRDQAIAAHEAKWGAIGQVADPFAEEERRARDYKSRMDKMRYPTKDASLVVAPVKMDIPAQLVLKP